MLHIYRLHSYQWKALHTNQWGHLIWRHLPVKCVHQIIHCPHHRLGVLDNSQWLINMLYVPNNGHTSIMLRVHAMLRRQTAHSSSDPTTRPLLQCLIDGYYRYYHCAGSVILCSSITQTDFNHNQNVLVWFRGMGSMLRECRCEWRMVNKNMMPKRWWLWWWCERWERIAKRKTNKRMFRLLLFVPVWCFVCLLAFLVSDRFCMDVWVWAYVYVYVDRSVYFSFECYLAMPLFACYLGFWCVSEPSPNG